MFSTLEGLNKEVTNFYSRLADLLSNKHLLCYSHMHAILNALYTFTFPAAFCHLGHPAGKSNPQA